MRTRLDKWDVIFVSDTVLIIVFLLSWLWNIGIIVDPEYINGFLAASSIIYGFWGIVFFGQSLFLREPKDDVGITYFAKLRLGLNRITLMLLAGMTMSIVAVYFGALGFVPSGFAFLVVACNFLVSLLSLVGYLLLERDYWHRKINHPQSKNNEMKEDDNQRSVEE